ncbi:hypothetical protein ACTAB9_17405 [Pseudomonas syringae]|uniref:hypothetical protein n=1 Tax=Pseudomonas syringae TaxID=317 RepID=UPI003F7516F8
MRTDIMESEIDTIDLKPFHEILAVRSADDYQGVAIYLSPRMAQYVSSNTESPVNETNYLMVAVGNPDDPETIERLKKKILARK